MNLSPKGTMGTFRVVDERTENGRICVMFCAFEGRPTIVRATTLSAIAVSLDGLPARTPP